MLTAPPLYAPSVDFYARLVLYSRWMPLTDVAFNGLKTINRCTIATPNGVQTLTIPIEKPEKGRHTLIADLRISDHGRWEHMHWGALFSAYGKSPFFEYVADDLHRIYEHHSHWLCEFNMAIHNIVADYMQLGQLGCATIVKEPVGESAAMPKALVEAAHGSDTTEPLVYHQLWSERNGFMPHLSIFDLLFNQGNAAPVVLLSL